jgi:hypothetical protein
MQITQLLTTAALDSPLLPHGVVYLDRRALS